MHTRAVQSPAFRPGERGLLVTGSDDRTARLWRLPEHGSRHRPVQVRELRPGPPWSPGASGRYSRYNGYKVDIALRSCVNEYIADRFRYLGRRSDGARRYRFPGGNPYAREGDHWDITYYHASEAGREGRPVESTGAPLCRRTARQTCAGVSVSEAGCGWETASRFAARFRARRSLRSSRRA